MSPHVTPTGSGSGSPISSSSQASDVDGGSGKEGGGEEVCGKEGSGREVGDGNKANGGGKGGGEDGDGKFDGGEVGGGEVGGGKDGGGADGGSAGGGGWPESDASDAEDMAVGVASDEDSGCDGGSGKGPEGSKGHGGDGGNRGGSEGGGGDGAGTATLMTLTELGSNEMLALVTALISKASSRLSTFRTTSALSDGGEWNFTWTSAALTIVKTTFVRAYTTGSSLCSSGGALGTLLPYMLWKLATLGCYGCTDLPPYLPLRPTDPVTRIYQSSYRRQHRL